MSSRTRSHSPYAPIRYEATRPFAPREFDTNSDGRQTVRREPIYAAAKKAGFAPTSREVKYEMNMAAEFARFCMSGRTIYDIKPSLLSALAETDIEDIPCGLIPTSESCYIHFGCPPVDSALMPFSISKEMEGAYVCVDSWLAMIGICVATRSLFQEKAFHRPQHSKIQYATFLIDIADPSLPLDQAIRKAARLSADSSPVPKGCDAISKFCDDQYAENLSILSLLVVAMLYLSTDQSDIEKGWQEGVPPALMGKYRGARSFNSRLTADRAIANDGYIKVYHVGQKFASSADGAAYLSATRDGHTVTTHLRRGHMRRQRHGEALSLTKTIWIAPVVINEGVAPTKGHIHVHKGPQADQG